MRFLFFILYMSACSPPPENPATDAEGARVNLNEPRIFENPVLQSPTATKYAASHILISWKGSVGSSQKVTRSEQAAERLARDIHGRVLDDLSFEALAQNHSDDPSSVRGGRLGTFFTGTMIPIFESAVASVPKENIAPLIKTPFGFHIIRRDTIEEARVSHILVSHGEAPKRTHTRPKAEAKDLIWKAYREVRNGVSFQQIAVKYSDDTTVKENGGELGLVGRGQMVPSFDTALFDLSSGQVSEPFETAYGFHVVLRRPN